ncbi:hypothetical protein HC031_21615 [Planosporangium thailandense]|uniref:DUF4267 domain-containing protein n=1 Tax=Planosporangium thailandense TaxID=765197 RepID=A0ABX0Y4K0_9ACTN|nr:hypothetical protein [Planosporangium thailandense]NJC72294.1 hypothetical protein [Planosporangium thailandense]
MTGPDVARRRRVAAARAAWGAALATAPAPVLRALGDRPDATARRITRLLGARHLAQAALTWLRPTDRMLALGAAVDAVHAATALALAAADGRWRRAARTDATAATTWAVLGLRERNRTRGTRH